GGQRLQALAHRISEVAQSFHVDDDDALQGRTALTYHQSLVELFLILGKQHAAAGVTQCPAKQLGIVVWMKTAAYATNIEDGEIDVHPFGASLCKHAGDVTLPEAGRTQSLTDIAHAHSELRPGRGLPDAVILL